MIALIVPCYNEEKRLKFENFLESQNLGVDLYFVDDGSTDRTAEVIAEYASKFSFIHLIKLEKNSGKAEAVRQGFLYAQKNLNLTENDWVGFWDADLATPLTEIPKMLQYAKLYDKVDSIWGSRVLRLGSNIQRKALRHYLGRGFATLVGELLKIKSYDSQCGAKLFKPSTLQAAFSEHFLSRWIFDVEILLRLQKFTIIEYPLTQWIDTPGSKVKIHREIFRVLWDILRLRRKYLE